MGKEEEVAAAIAHRLGLQQQLGLTGCQFSAPCFLKTSLCHILAASRAAQSLRSLFYRAEAGVHRY